MLKKYFIELSEFNIWANGRVCDWLDKISEEQWNQPLVSSFNTIYETILHTAGAEKIWKEISLNFKKLIEELPENQFQQKLLFRNSKGIEYNQPHYQVLAHVVNHSTYHRGQVVTMLRQVGFTNVDSTDITTYFRIKNELPTEMFSN